MNDLKVDGEFVLESTMRDKWGWSERFVCMTHVWISQQSRLTRGPESTRSRRMRRRIHAPC